MRVCTVIIATDPQPCFPVDRLEKSPSNSQGNYIDIATGSPMESQLEPCLKASAMRHGPWANGTIIVALIFLVLSAGLYAFSWNSGSVGFLSDDAVYLLMADGFSPFRSAEPGLIAYVMRQTLFPPLYPLLLAVLGAGSGSLLWAHLITTTTLVLALGFYGLWIDSQIRDRVPTIGLLLIFNSVAGCLGEGADRFIVLPARGHRQGRSVFESEKCSTQFLETSDIRFIGGYSA